MTAIVPTTWQGTGRQKYLQYFARSFDTSAGRDGSHAARMLRKFYCAPTGSVVIATGQGKVLGAAKICSVVKYRDNGIDQEGHVDEDYVREVNQWLVLDIALDKVPVSLRGRLFHPHAVLEFPTALLGQFVATIVAEKGQMTGKRVERLL